MRIRSELKRKLRKDLGQRLGQLRETLELSRNKVAGMLNVHRGSLQRNEEGKALPEISTLFKLSETFDVSMDWLFFNKGPMFYKQKTAEEKEREQNPINALPEEYRELLEHMEKLPVLRYEILLQFRRFLQDDGVLPDDAAPTEEPT